MNAVEQKMIAHLEVSHVSPILAQSRPRHVHSYGMLHRGRGKPPALISHPDAITNLILEALAV
jgi:hypothetical protein